MEDLAQFIGSDYYYRHPFTKIVYTDGVKYLAETGSCYWLIDEIVFAQSNKRLKVEGFQTWTLTVDLQSKMAVLRCEDGNNNLLLSKDIEYTDFSLPSITLWLSNETLMLPSEY